MTAILRGKTDPEVAELQKALDAYEREFAVTGAEAAIYRQNPAAIRIRIIDRRFEGMSRARRHEIVWEYLEQQANDDAMSEISLLLLLAPAELGNSFANFEFEDPAGD